MASRCGARSTAEDDLVAHELAIILPDGAGGWPKARIRCVGADGPLPDVAEELLEAGEGGGSGGVEVVGFEEVGSQPIQ